MLKSLLTDFEAIASHIDESPHKFETVPDLVQRLALSKAKELYCRGRTVISADTLIEYDSKPVGKTLCIEDARSTFQLLTGQFLKVWTATCVITDVERVNMDLSEAHLKMARLSESELNQYLESEVWLGKAGGFSIAEQPCPVTLLRGDIDIVRGMSLSWIKKVLGRIR